MYPRKQSGMTLMEMMIALAIVGIIVSIALPMYQDYAKTAQQGVMSDNIQTIRMFQEDRRLSEGAYAAGTYDPADPNVAGGLKETLGWSPRTASDQITYVVDNVTATGFRVTATHEDGTVVQKDF